MAFSFAVPVTALVFSANLLDLLIFSKMLFKLDLVSSNIEACSVVELATFWDDSNKLVDFSLLKSHLRQSVSRSFQRFNKYRRCQINYYKDNQQNYRNGF